MTNFKIINNNEIYEIEIKGHSNFSTHGSDIVCASISTAIYMTFNNIELLEPGYNLSNSKLDDGYAIFKVEKKYNNACKLLESLEFTLKDLEKQFPKNIKQIN